jgi:hypothetical protein
MSSNHHHYPYGPEADGKSSPREGCLDLDLSDCWFFLGLFSPNWREMPLPAAGEDVDALCCPIGWKKVGRWDVDRKWKLGLWYATNEGWTADMTLVHTWRE